MKLFNCIPTIREDALTIAKICIRANRNGDKINRIGAIKDFHAAFNALGTMPDLKDAKNIIEYTELVNNGMPHARAAFQTFAREYAPKEPTIGEILSRGLESE